MKKENSYKLFITHLIGIIICLFVFIISLFSIKTQIVLEIVKTISISGFTAFLLSLITQIISKNDFEIQLKDLMEKDLPLLNNLSERGLVGYEKSFPLENDIYMKDFLNSKVVTLVMNDGKRFISNNIDVFRERFSENGKETRFIFLNPDCKDSISVLTRKNGHEGDYYINKIKEYRKDLQKFEDEYPYHKIKVLYQNYFTTMGILLTDNYAMISLYRISPGQDIVPNLIFKKNQSEINEYKKIYDDVNRLSDEILKTFGE